MHRSALSPRSCWWLRPWVAALCLVILVVSTSAAGAEELILLPTSIAPASRLRRPASEAEEELAETARNLDFVLSEAAQDLGLTLDVSQRPREPEPRSEAELVARATDSWVLAAQIARERGNSVDVRLSLVAPGSRVVMVRRATVAMGELDVEAMKMLRDLVNAGRGSGIKPEPAAAPAPTGEVATRAHSPGRAVLALNGAGFGAYVGYSVQRASGSDDVRLTYPLTALGAGVGLGASIIVADEWDVGPGDAWYLAAGGWWSCAGALLLSDGYDVRPVEDRYLYGLLGATGGLTLATTALSLHHVSPGGAALTHSGGAFGALLGGLVDAGATGTTSELPSRGMGYGAMAGTIASGVVATQVDISPSRVLFIDLLGGLGGLVGAAVASPLIVGDEANEPETRAWLASIGAGTLAGATVGLVTTKPRRPSARVRAPVWGAIPYGGAVASALTEHSMPPLGIGVRGWW